MWKMIRHATNTLSLLLVFAFLGFAFMNSANAAQPACTSSYESAVSIINDSAIGQGLKTQLLAHTKNAWRTYSSGKPNSKVIALKQIDIALQQIDLPSNGAVSPQTKDQLRSTIKSLRGCISGVTTIDMATLTVRVFLPSDLDATGILGPAPAGVIINIDGVEFGATGPDGTLKIQVPARTILVEARLYPSSLGQTSVTLARGEIKEVSITLAEGKEISESASLAIDQVKDGILDRAFTSLTLRFLNADQSTALLQSIDLIALVDPLGGASKYVTEMFSLQSNGTLVLTNVNGFRDLLLSRPGKIILNVHGMSSSGRVYDSSKEFYLSVYKVSGRLVQPPSNPLLTTSGIFVVGKILNTDLVFNTVSDANGNFVFPLLPAGNLELYSETLQSGVYYYGQGILVLNSNKSIGLNMLSTVDLQNGVPPYTVTALATTQSALINDANTQLLKVNPLDVSRRNQISIASGAPLSSANLVAALADPAKVSISVSAGAQDVPSTQSATLTVAKGVKTVELTYTVSTIEYPYYVLSQSIYNDTWSLAVRAGTSGQQLFNISRQINSQLSVSPVWQSDGSTGQIKETVDVGNLTLASDTTLTLFATSTNVGDDLLTTTVNASLGEKGVKINSITPDSSVPLDFHSIPRSGELNTFDRYFTLKITKPEASTVKKMTVTLLAPDSVMTVVDEAPGTAPTSSVEEIDAQTLRIRVSLKSTPSSVNTQPPPTHKLKYRFKLAVDDAGTEVTDEKDSGDRRGLWRMPAGFGRYSTRDTGGDDWSSKGAYGWLDANRPLITKINDVSGEHGRDIGHQTHKHGTDIDAFHFYTFPGAVSGGDNYAKLRADVILASSTAPANLAQAAAAKQRVIGWISATKIGLDNLANNATVVELRYALGGGGGGLQSGWARDILKTGKTTIAGVALDFGTGTWSNAKYLPVGDHNDHIHITLSRPALGE